VGSLQPHSREVVGLTVIKVTEQSSFDTVDVVNAKPLSLLFNFKNLEESVFTPLSFTVLFLIPLNYFFNILFAKLSRVEEHGHAVIVCKLRHVHLVLELTREVCDDRVGESITVVNFHVT
jgi:hypothetical protein